MGAMLSSITSMFGSGATQAAGAEAGATAGGPQPNATEMTGAMTDSTMTEEERKRKEAEAAQAHKDAASGFSVSPYAGTPSANTGFLSKAESQHNQNMGSLGQLGRGRGKF